MHVTVILLLFGPFGLFFIKKLVAIKVGRTRFSAWQDSVAKQKGRSWSCFSGGSFARPILAVFLAYLYSYEDKQICE